MIVQINQTRTSFNMNWEILAGGEKIAEAEAPFLPNMFIAEIRNESFLRKLSFNPRDTSHGKSLAERMSFRVLDSNHEVGFIRGQNKMLKKLFASYPYYVYEDSGVTYSVYEVGFGNKGLYLCFYKDEELFCIVEKDLVTINYQDKYTAYLMDDTLLPIVGTFVIYYDVVSFGDFMEISVHSKKKSVVNTYQKELIAKYDETFIPKVKAMENQ